jgi:hypothetical protein
MRNAGIIAEINLLSNETGGALIPHQGILCGVAFPPEGYSSLRRIAPYASVVAPRRLASDALLVIRNCPKSASLVDSANSMVNLGGVSKGEPQVPYCK